MRRIWLPPLVSALAAFGFFLAAMAYPWQLALLAATAIGAFVYSTQITWQRMRRLARPPEARRSSHEEPPATKRTGD